MIKVITYGTYDLLHEGHIRLLERAKALGDYLIVGVTSDDFDRSRGKINVKQSLTERIEGIKKTGLADEIIVEEYEGQKIDDIQKYGVSIFTVGSDWEGYFDYLKEYCTVIYLPRTTGISSSELRAEDRKLNLGLLGGFEENVLNKYFQESSFVNGITVTTLFNSSKSTDVTLQDYDDFLEDCDCVYILSHPTKHYREIKHALERGKHVLCESPIALTLEETKELFALAEKKNLILMEAIKTAYSNAYNRLILLVKTGKIGKVVSVDATCTSLQNFNNKNLETAWNSICAWGPTAMLPIFQLLQGPYETQMYSLFENETLKYDSFTKIDFFFQNATASIKVGRGVKSEGELIISGTEGYIYVPAPWWKTDYFELRFEDPNENRRYFYPLEGEGIRLQLLAFSKAIMEGIKSPYIRTEVSEKISSVIESFYSGQNLRKLSF
ncbi:Gfo/Idh/MocA family oxidoreductase [Oribacterium sp. oral taxon 108]|uniref:Gfo/Idh/MocA family oxidoreductase n=1 Tax=Oribacterium sp. oral taxon 108 TaxID=712414 RepID=UPI00020DD12C|nr:Gfo/Idh/MocA family oxidoreductase [Oribacterium sp. oral taxon 108]EGL37471.1 putative glycerol-3-phosphate cytidylyltransferase [Oribacterium sp. oral taxon 108 str. F0425]